MDLLRAFEVFLIVSGGLFWAVLGVAWILVRGARKEARRESGVNESRKIGETTIAIVKPVNGDASTTEINNLP